MSPGLELDPSKLMRPLLDRAEAALDAGRAGEAETWLNAAAERLRVLGLGDQNRCPLYRRLSSGAAHLRSDGDWRTATQEDS